MVLEYHKHKDTIQQSKDAKKEWAEATTQKRTEAVKAWMESNGYAGTVELDPVEVVAEYVVLDQWKDVNELHDALLAAGQEPAMVEAGADGSWMRFTFETDDVAEARKIIEG